MTPRLDSRLPNVLLEGDGARQEAGQLLHVFVTSRDEARADAYLERLISGQVSPLIYRVIGRTVRGATDRSAYGTGGDAEAVYDRAVCTALEELRAARARYRQATALGTKDQRAIRDLRGFVATLTHQAYYRTLNEKYPERRRLKDRLLYLLERDERFAVWHTTNGVRLCASADTPDAGTDYVRGTLPGGAFWARLQQDPVEAAREVLSVVGERPTDARQFAGMLKRLLDRIGHAVPVDALLGVLTVVCGIREARPVVTAPSDETGVDQWVEGTPDDSPPVDSRLLGRENLTELWGRLRRLPLAPRRALLLTLRNPGERGDEPGSSPLQDVIAQGLTTISEVARLMDYDPTRFADLLPCLPLSEKEAAALLDTNPNNLRQLRFTARRHLRRGGDA